MKHQRTSHPHHDQIEQSIRGWLNHPEYLDITIGTVGQQVLEPWLKENVSRDIAPSFLNQGNTFCCAALPTGQERLFLAHVGAMPGHSPRTDLEIMPVTQANLDQFVRLRLLAFSAKDGDKVHGHGETAGLYETLGDDEVASETAKFYSAMDKNGAGLLATISGKPVGLLWSSELAQDVWINLLGVRHPYRRQGIAHALLKQRMGEAYSAGFRSIIVSINSKCHAARKLCHKLGFQDEVYRQQG